MQFYEYPTAYQRVNSYLSKKDFKDRFANRDGYYNTKIGEMINSMWESQNMPSSDVSSLKVLKFERHYHQYVGETFYYEIKKPYFQIHPQVVEVFSNAKSENIPLSKIVFPSSAFSIHLAKDPLNNFVIGPNGQVVRSIFCAVNHEIMPSSYGKNGQAVGSILLVIDVGEDYCLQAVMTFTDWNQTVENALEEMDQGDAEEYDKNFPVRCMRLVLSVGFLIQSNNEIVEPHVLSKDIGVYYSVSEESRKQIEEKAVRRRGAVGFRVGFPREHVFPITSPPIQSREQYTLSEKTLKLAHLRSGHWHLVRHGKNKSESKVIWYFPTVVRPDLPFVAPF